MNVAAMAAVAALVLAEKTLSGGKTVSYSAAVELVMYGVAVMANPALLPTVA